MAGASLIWLRVNIKLRFVTEKRKVVNAEQRNLSYTVSQSSLSAFRLVLFIRRGIFASEDQRNAKHGRIKLLNYSSMSISGSCNECDVIMLFVKWKDYAATALTEARFRKYLMTCVDRCVHKLLVCRQCVMKRVNGNTHRSLLSFGICNNRNHTHWAILCVTFILFGHHSGSVFMVRETDHWQVKVIWRTNMLSVLCSIYMKLRKMSIVKKV